MLSYRSLPWNVSDPTGVNIHVINVPAVFILNHWVKSEELMVWICDSYSFLSRVFSLYWKGKTYSAEKVLYNLFEGLENMKFLQFG